MAFMTSSQESEWPYCYNPRAHVGQCVFDNNENDGFSKLLIEKMKTSVWHESQPIIGRLVRAVVEHLQERRAAKMKHELWIERKLLRETERTGIIFVEITKLLTLQLHQSTQYYKSCNNCRPTAWTAVNEWVCRV